MLGLCLSLESMLDSSGPVSTVIDEAWFWISSGLQWGWTTLHSAVLLTVPLFLCLPFLASSLELFENLPSKVFIAVYLGQGTSKWITQFWLQKQILIWGNQFIIVTQLVNSRSTVMSCWGNLYKECLSLPKPLASLFWFILDLLWFAFIIVCLWMYMVRALIKGLEMEIRSYNSCL